MSTQSEASKSLIVCLKYMPRVTSRSGPIKSLIVCLKYGPGTSTASRASNVSVDVAYEQDTATQDSRYTGSIATISVYNDDTDTDLTPDSLLTPMCQASKPGTQHRLRLRFLGSTISRTLRPSRALSPPNPSFRSADKIMKTGTKRRYQSAESQREFYVARMAALQKRDQALTLFNRIINCLSSDLSESEQVTIKVLPEHSASCWDASMLMPDMLEVFPGRDALNLSNGEGSSAALETPASLDDILDEAVPEQFAWPEASANAGQHWTGLAAAGDIDQISPETGLLADTWLGFVEEGSWGQDG